jgi:L1 cell adhesion molecule like protein
MSAFKPACNAVAIDLGTTRCRVGVWRNEAFELITDCFGNRFTPSWVAFTEAEHVVGEAAQAQAHRNTANTVYDIKRLLGRDFDDCTAISHLQKWPFRVVQKDGGQTAVDVVFKGERKRFSPEAVAAVLFANAKQMAETHLGSAITHAVITAPSYFSAAQRQAIMHAASLAGLPVVRIARDTSCAALAYRLTPSAPAALCHHVVVCNVGGGPCSASLVGIDEGVLQVVAVSASSTSVSGADFDQRLLSWCVQVLRNKHCKDATADISLDNRALHRLRLACERAKCILSSNSETIIEVDALFLGADFTATITRSQFEEVCDDLFCRIVEPVNEVLRVSKCSKESIGEIVVCGGGARMPKACHVLQQLFGGKQVNRAVNADEAATQGAALLAAAISGSTKLNHRCDFTLLDVSPISLGIAGPDGAFLKIVDRNSTIPCEKSLVCTTSLDYQTTFTIRIYEGEDREKEQSFSGCL